jgi:hypothetical protein
MQKDVDFVMSKGKKLGRGITAYRHNVDINCGRAVLG